MSMSAFSYKAWYLENRDKVRASQAQYYQRTKAEKLARQKERRKINPEHFRAIERKYESKSLDKRAIRNRVRRGVQKQATPLWADKELINDMYIEAKYQGLHVDHIVPLKGKMVCGLHWEGNLQLLSKEDNLMKRNHVGI